MENQHIMEGHSDAIYLKIPYTISESFIPIWYQ